MQSPEKSQVELACYIDLSYDALQIAASIERHGFFDSEPLIAIQEQSDLIVVEGNRRLTALLGLTDKTIRQSLESQTPRWARVAFWEVVPDIPVLVVERRDQIVPLLGFRHISGIEPWEPWAQARFIAGLVEQGKTLDEIADLVGRKTTQIRSMFRDFDILRQARDEFGLDTSRAESDFGVFNAAMNRVKIRDYIDAPLPKEVDPDQFPLPESSRDRMQELLEFVFGGEGGIGRVVRESRQLSELADVLSDPSGRAVKTLKETGDLSEAVIVAQPAPDVFRSSLTSAIRALKRAASTEAPQGDSLSLQRLEEVIQRASDLRDRVAGKDARTGDI